MTHPQGSRMDIHIWSRWMIRKDSNNQLYIWAGFQLQVDNSVQVYM